MGRAGSRKPRIRKIQRKIPRIPNNTFQQIEVELEAKRLYEQLKRQRDEQRSPEDSELDEITEAELSSTSNGGDTSSSSPEPPSESTNVSGTSGSAKKQTRRRSASQRRRQWRTPRNLSGSSSTSTNSSSVASSAYSTGGCGLRNLRAQMDRHTKGCNGEHKNLSCKEMEKLQALSDHLLSVRQSIYLALRFSFRMQLLFVGHFHRTIPQLKSIEEAIYITDRFLRWMVSQPNIVLQLARRLCCCNNKLSSCHFDTGPEEDEEDKDDDDEDEDEEEESEELLDL